MGDTENTAAAGENNDQGNEYKAPATQADLDRIVQDRVARVHTQYAGFDDFKAKAEQAEGLLSKITAHEATIGELTGKIQTFEGEKERATLVSDVAKAKNVPAEALRGTTREELEAHADTLAALLKPTAPVIEGQARTATPESDSMRAFAKNLFDSNKD